MIVSCAALIILEWASESQLVKLSEECIPATENLSSSPSQESKESIWVATPLQDIAPTSTLTFNLSVMKRMHCLLTIFIFILDLLSLFYICHKFCCMCSRIWQYWPVFIQRFDRADTPQFITQTQTWQENSAQIMTPQLQTEAAQQTNYLSCTMCVELLLCCSVCGPI